MSEFTPIQRMTVGNDGSVRVEMGYTADMLDRMAALLSQEVDEELMKRIAPKFGYVKERTCKREELKGETYLFRCSECGVERFEGAHYCMKCGAKVVEE